MRKASVGLCTIAALALLAGCSVSKETSGQTKECLADSADGIIGGTSVSKEDLLSKKVVLLLASDGDSKSWICTGTPITDDVILTAAHCVKGAAGIKAIFSPSLSCSSGFKVSQNSIDASDFTYDHQFKSNNAGNGNKNHDIGLVRLKSNIPGDYQISKIYDGNGHISSSDVTLIGYGVTSEGDEAAPILRTKTKNMLSEVTIGTNYVSIYQAEGGVCSGDSGGPVFAEVDGELQILGVTSYGSGASEETVCHGVGYATYGPTFQDWVNSNIKYLSK